MGRGGSLGPAGDPSGERVELHARVPARRVRPDPVALQRAGRMAPRQPIGDVPGEGVAVFGVHRLSMTRLAVARVGGQCERPAGPPVGAERRGIVRPCHDAFAASRKTPLGFDAEDLRVLAISEPLQQV
jgi:hypothetical protein